MNIKFCPPMFVKAYDNADVSQSATGSINAPWSKNGNSENVSINTSGILTELIQNAGRFCQSYASDLFIDWESIQGYLNKLVYNNNNNTSELFIMGIRKNGIDGIRFTYSRAADFHKNDTSMYDYYSKIYALRIDVDNNDVKITLKDITTHILWCDDLPQIMEFRTQFKAPENPRTLTGVNMVFGSVLDENGKHVFTLCDDSVITITRDNSGDYHSTYRFSHANKDGIIIFIKPYEGHLFVMQSDIEKYITEYLGERIETN